MIKDLAGKDRTSILNCESEPIHIPGAIQPHGVLLVVNENKTIVCCSANCEAAFAQKPPAILQQPLGIVSKDLEEKLQAVLEQDVFPARPFLFSSAGQEWEVFVSQSDDCVLVELEAYSPDAYDPEDLFDQTKQFVTYIERSRSLQELCQRIAEQTRRITGYDRVMIYRFDKEYNGEVYAESKAPEMEPFLHLHYPHTDIPSQARDLYLRNMVRLIADVDYTPVSLLTTENSLSESPDLSDSVLRSVSPIHIQYLRNMGVGATLTISLLLEGKLWGLIACHHRQPRHLGYAQRKAALLQGHFLTSQIKVRQVAEEYDVHTVVEAHLQQLLTIIPQEGDFAVKFGAFSSLLPVANASGVAVLHKGKIYDKGLVPPSEKMRLLFDWLAAHTSGLQFCTSHLRQHYPGAEKISRQAAGILYHKLGNGATDAIIWFREEVEMTIHWAGDPQEAIRKVQENNLDPRSSFAIYKEQVRYQSLEWKISEINAATRFASALQNRFHLEYLQQEEVQQRLLNERLMKANQELANINWITSHDLKEPLRKILLFSSRMMSGEEKDLSEKVQQSITKIQKSALRMQTLVNDIVSYSLTDDKQADLSPTDLNVLVREVLAEYEEEKGHNLQATVSTLPVVVGIPYQLRQLFVNLISNAVKFARAGELLQIDIRCEEVNNGFAVHPLLEKDRKYYRIEIIDNGIGFDASQNDRIFDIFYRLNDRDAYEGTGIGLAICKRIVENHKGVIRAIGKKDAGASFQVFLPQADGR